MSDVVLVAKITELLLPNRGNPQLEPTASSFLRGDGTRLASPRDEIPTVSFENPQKNKPDAPDQVSQLKSRTRSYMVTPHKSTQEPISTASSFPRCSLSPKKKPWGVSTEFHSTFWWALGIHHTIPLFPSPNVVIGGRNCWDSRAAVAEDDLTAWRTWSSALTGFNKADKRKCCL